MCSCLFLILEFLILKRRRIQKECAQMLLDNEIKRVYIYTSDPLNFQFRKQESQIYASKYLLILSDLRFLALTQENMR